MSAGSLDRVRAREYPAEPDGIFFNAASWGILPRSTTDEVADLTVRRNRTHGFEEAELGAIQRRCRSAVAALLDVAADEIVLAPNTSYGIGLAAALVAAGPPGAVVLSEGEFPANVVPWRTLESRGFELRKVPTDPAGLPDEDALVRAVAGEDVRALTVSAVQWISGHRADLGRLGRACRENGVLFCVDAIQALGAAPVRPRVVGADVVASGGQKWLCAPWGSGFAYVRRELQGRFDPPMASWLAIEGSTRFEESLPDTLDWHGDGRKFELATLGVQDYLGLARSVEVFLEAGVERIGSHLRAVQQPLLDWIDARSDVALLTPRDPERRAGIVSFRPADVGRVADALRAERVIFSVRSGAVRFAPHFYNVVEEMERAVEILDRS